MIILDTDVFSFIEIEDSPEFAMVRSRVAQLDPPQPVVVTVITYEEQTRGRLGKVAASKKPKDLLYAYLKLRGHIANYLKIQVLDFDAPALTEYEKLRRRGIRIGTLDLRIAAIAMSQNAVLITRNLQDFRQVPGLRVEDWTVS